MGNRTTANVKEEAVGIIVVPYERIRARKQLPRQSIGSFWVQVGVLLLVCCWIQVSGVEAATAAPPSGEEEGDCSSSSGGVCGNPEEEESGNHGGGGGGSGGNTCRLYMAPTTVGGIEGNYGIFTAVDLPKGATVLANDGPNIPVVLDNRNFPSRIFPKTDHIGLFNNVWWGLGTVSDQLHSEFRLEDKERFETADLQINFGALPNCHPYRPNIESSMPLDGIDYDDRRYLTGKKHFENPLRGSFSYYTGKHFGVNGFVAAGRELFLDYTADWEQHGFPRTQDYFSAAALVRKWMFRVKQRIDEEQGRDIRDRDPSSIVPIQDAVNGAKALLELTRVEAPVDLNRKAMPAQLPPGWTEHFDPASGQPYYYNSADKTSSWDRPESPAQEEDDVPYFHNQETITRGIYQLEQITSRVLSVLPQTTDDWDRVYQQSWNISAYRQQKSQGGPRLRNPRFPSVKDVADAMHEVSQPPPKSNQELRETGICLDHIVAGTSTIPLELGETAEGERIIDPDTTIGRGAIAARFLPKGELVVPVPFLHLLDRSLFEKYRGADGMILNYCFGHFESTLIICPVTNAVLVNHCSDRNGRFSCGGGDGENKKGPNAAYRWASESDWDRKTNFTLTMTLRDLSKTNYKQQHRMMSMEIFATRDIQEGEEIFIDYGEKWEEAWLEHVRNWRANQQDTNPSWSSPLTSFELNHGGLLIAGGEGERRDEEEDDDLLFYGDLRDDRPALSYDGRFMAMCWYQDTFPEEYGLGSHHSWDPDMEDEDDEYEDPFHIYWKDLADDEIYEEYAIDVGYDRTVDFTHFADHDPGMYGHFWPCSILSKNDDEDGIDEDDEDDEDRYSVRIFPSDYHFDAFGDEWQGSSYPAVHVLLTNYPRSSIRFVVGPHKGDHFHPKAFRHHIEINDDIFPEQWKNNKEEHATKREHIQNKIREEKKSKKSH